MTGGAGVGREKREQRVSDDVYKLYVSTRSDYIARERAASEKADQVVLAGAAAALALSLTFIEKLAPAPAASTMSLLAWAWVSLITSLGLALLSFEVRSQAYAIARRELDIAQDPEGMSMTKVDWCNRALLGLKIGSLTTLLVGVILLIRFAYANIQTS